MAILPEFRRLTSADRPLLLAHLLRLETDCRRARFGQPVGDGFLRGYAGRADLTNTILYACFSGPDVRGVGELRSLGPMWGAECEAAITVERTWRNLGIGTGLMRGLLGEAERGNVSCIYFSGAPVGEAMQRVVDKALAYFPNFSPSRDMADVLANTRQSVSSFADPAPHIVILCIERGIASG